MSVFAVLIDDLGIEVARGQCIGKKVMVFHGWNTSKYDPVAIRALSMEQSTTGTVKGAAWGLWIAGPLGAALGSMIGGGPKVRFEIDTLEGETLRCVASREGFLSIRQKVERLIERRSAKSVPPSRGRRVEHYEPDQATLRDKPAKNARNVAVFAVASWLSGLFAILCGLAMLSPTGKVGLGPSIAFLIAGLLVLPPVVKLLRKRLPPLRPRWVSPVLATFMMLIATWLVGLHAEPADTAPRASAIQAEPFQPTDYWVKDATASEHDQPDGTKTNTLYYRQKVTVYERQGPWVRTTEDRAEPRWMLAEGLSPTRPTSRPSYRGPTGTRNARIAADAIPNPGEGGLTQADVDILWRGANLVLAAHHECSGIDLADKSVSRSGTYYVTCDVEGAPRNVFFTEGEVERGRLK